MRSSLQHVTNELSGLSKDVKRPRELSHDDQALQIARWARDLTGYEPHVVSEACRRWRDEHDAWPQSWREIRSAFDEAAARDRKLPREAKRADQASLSQAVNIAFGYLSNAHLRELDRIDPERRQQIVNETARWFLPHWQEAAAHQSQGQVKMRPWIAMINEFIEARLGKTWRQILDQEAADRGPTVGPAAGFKRLDTAIEEALGQTVVARATAPETEPTKELEAA